MGGCFDCEDDSFEQLDKRIADAIYAYNYLRPHQGIQMRTPMEYIRKCSGKGVKSRSSGRVLPPLFLWITQANFDNFSKKKHPS